jgi:hypothetical protein
MGNGCISLAAAAAEREGTAARVALAAAGRLLAARELACTRRVAAALAAEEMARLGYSPAAAARERTKT